LGGLFGVPQVPMQNHSELLKHQKFLDQRLVLRGDSMFVSHSQFEFSFPEGLAEPGSKQWRLIEFSHHTPWFLLSVSELTEEGEILLTHTWCIAWQRDLTQILATIEHDKIRGLVCMIPGWSSPSSQWTSREICEVWLVRTVDAGDCVRFLDREGNEFDGDMRNDFSDHEVERKQLLKLGTCHAHS